MNPAEFFRDCPESCPGCKYRGQTLEFSRSDKIKKFHAICSQWKNAIRPLEMSRTPLRGYRKRACLSAEHSETGWAFGLRHGRDHALLPIPHCPIQSSYINHLIADLKTCLPPYAQFPLHYAVFSSRLVTLIIKSKTLPETKWIDALSLEGFDGVYLNLNPVTGRRRVFNSKNWILIHGKSLSQADDGFTYGPRSFQQPDLDLELDALRSAEVYLNPQASDAVIDLYSGIGRSLSLWRKRTEKVIGVEICSEASRLSGSLPGKAADRLPQIRNFLEQARPKKAAVYANPPRSGLEPDVCQWLEQEDRVDKLAYLSCNPRTLQRDLAQLCTSNWRVDQLKPYDFFPMTGQIETLALLERHGRTPSTGT